MGGEMNDDDDGEDWFPIFLIFFLRKKEGRYINKNNKKQIKFKFKFKFKKYIKKVIKII